MTRSSFVTSGRRATEMAFHRILRKPTPYVSQASQKIFRMSDDLFVKIYLGYSTPFMRFSDRHPSEWISPRSKQRACLSAITFCQGASSIRRKLSSRSVLRKEARPMLPIRRDLDASHSLKDSHPSGPMDHADGTSGLLNHGWVTGIEHDSQPVRARMS
jgi:hypothetical protein